METKFPTETIHFFSGKNKKIVGRLANGKIAIITYGYHGQWVNDGDDWLCEILKEEETKAIVNPVSIVKTAEQNYAESCDKCRELASNGFKKPFFKPKGSRFYTTL